MGLKVHSDNTNWLDFIRGVLHKMNFKFVICLMMVALPHFQTLTIDPKDHPGRHKRSTVYKLYCPTGGSKALQLYDHEITNKYVMREFETYCQCEEGATCRKNTASSNYDCSSFLSNILENSYNVKLMLKLTHKFSVMVDSTTDSDMLDMPTMPLLPSPSPPLSPRPSRLPALRSPPNIALMSQLSR